MYLARTLALSTLLGGLLSAPFFAFAQTVATTTAIQPPDPTQERAVVQTKIDAMTQDYLNSFPTPNEINLKAIVDDIDIKTNPQNPGPNELVTATLIGHIANLNKATISWSMNGKIVSSGIGQKTLTFQNGRSGETTIIKTTVVTANGERVQKDFSFTPIGVTILWEADTYVPPFYKGKPLISPESHVRAIAIPDIENTRGSLSAGDLVYTWKKNNMTQVDASGYQKNYFPFIAPMPFGKTEVSVNVSSLAGPMQSQKKIELPLSNPFILFYEKHPLLGVWYNRPFGTDVTLDRPEFSISAEPYFFSNETSDVSTLKYDWTVNGKSAQNYAHTITLRNDAGVKGNSAISLTMRNLHQTFQSGVQNLGVHFMGTETTSRPTI